jgi:branched-chain amino acid transport system permease protein
MEFALTTLLNGLSYGLLLFMLSSGLTLIFSMMGVLNFAHTSFYMLGAYFAYSISLKLGFWPALFIAPLLMGVLGAAIERFGLRAIHQHGHVHELLFTFGLAFVIAELVQVVWGRPPVPYRVPPELDGPLFTLFTTTFPIYRGFMMLIAVLMLASIYVVLKRTRVGLVIQAALTHPQMVESLGHDVPRVFMAVFGGGSALAALAGVIGGLGSLAGALTASLLIGVVQTFSVAIDGSLASVLSSWGADVGPQTWGWPLLSLTVAQAAPIMPYLFMVLILILRPRGLMGTRET